jgi:hypothetical protein
MTHKAFLWGFIIACGITSMVVIIFAFVLTWGWEGAFVRLTAPRAGVEYGTTEPSSDSRFFIDRADQQCSTDSDCWPIITECNRCECGGVVHKDYIEKYSDILYGDVCALKNVRLCEASCPKIPRCINNFCTLVDVSDLPSSQYELQTYQNQEAGYEIQYPQDWEYEHVGDSLTLGKIGETYSVEGSDASAIRIGQRAYAGTYQERFDALLQRANSYNGKIQELQIASTPALQIVDYLGTKTIILYDQKEYTISASNFGSENLNREILSVYNDVLASFRFLDLGSTDAWQVYRNEGLGFELSLPSTWEQGLEIIYPQEFVEQVFVHGLVELRNFSEDKYFSQDAPLYDKGDYRVAVSLRDLSEEELNLSLLTYVEQQKDSEFYSEENKEYNNVRIGGIDAVEYAILEENIREVYIPYNNNMYVVGVYGGGDVYVSEIETILNSFRIFE